MVAKEIHYVLEPGNEVSAPVPRKIPAAGGPMAPAIIVANMNKLLDRFYKNEQGKGSGLS